MDSEKLREKIMSEDNFPLYLTTWSQVTYKILELQRAAEIDAIALMRLEWFRNPTEPWRRQWYMVHNTDAIWRIMNNHELAMSFEISRFCLIMKELYVSETMLRVLVVISLKAGEDIEQGQQVQW